MRRLQGRSEIEEMAANLLVDESSLSGGWCTEAAWPESAEEVEECIASFLERGIGITVSGAMTGIAGGAVPDGGAVISTASLKGIRAAEEGSVHVLAGTTLEELREWLGQHMEGWFYPPDPTEATATTGGTIATDASGSDSYMYGSTRRWVEELDLVLPDGLALHLPRGSFRFDNDGICRHPRLGSLKLPVLTSRPPSKNAAGYWMQPGMDLVDLFIGSEGTLGLVTGATLRLAREPLHTVDTAVFTGSAERFWHLFHALRGSGLRIRALEMMDDLSLDFLSKNYRGEDLGLPSATGWVLLSRFESGSDEELDQLLLALEEAVEEAGISPDMVWGGFEPRERARIRDFRHVLPETVNGLIAARREKFPSIHKLSTDSAVPVDLLEDFYSFTRTTLESTGMDCLVFGHAGQGHLHSNTIPSGPDEEAAGERALRTIAARAVQQGGTVSAEHGLGRLKADLIGLMYTPSELEGMRGIREAVDPGGVFAPAISWP